MKVAVFRKEHFNAAHRLYNPAWTDEKTMRYLENVTIPITTDTITS